MSGIVRSVAVGRSIGLCLICGCSCWFFSIARATPPELPDGSEVAVKRMAAFKVPEGMKVELFAAEPQLASPVAIGLDERNRVFVAEEYRFNLGTEENRTRPFFLEDDLQLQTLDDRLKMYEKFAKNFAGGMEWFRKVGDQVRLVEDIDGDGKADRSTVFAPDFNGTLDGLAAGIMAQDGEIYFTCIPNLWRLRDTDDDGIADERTVIHTGFGVNAGFLGHDLHGLCRGPDGKLYFSVGDRGFHLMTHAGEILHGPRNGAVFRCYPDGRDLEVVCRGLRNPQELAFDQFGNLFAADNNCDKGDHSRLVYCLEGSDSGWNMSFQSIPEPYLTGPWSAERMWSLWTRDVAATQPQGVAVPSSRIDDDRPGWLLPPVGKLGAGPSGFTYYPGTGLPPRYDHHFLMCNFTGNGGIESFSLKGRGAGFEMIDEHDFMKPILASDCEFGYDGKLYVADFVNLIWNGGSAGGRIYTVFDPRYINDPAVKSTKELVRSGFKKLETDRLKDQLSHADQRVRQRAQFELVARGNASTPVFQATLATSTHPLARLHALWGLGQLAESQRDTAGRSTDNGPNAAEAIMLSLGDKDDEIRAWSARLLGDRRHQAAAGALVKLLADRSPRVRLFAAMAIGKLRYDPGPPPLLHLINQNDDADPWLKHGCVMALAGIATSNPHQFLTPLFAEKSAAIRHAALLATRYLYKQRHEWSFHLAADAPVSIPFDEHCQQAMQDLLRDEDPRIVTEAARAINDLPLPAAYPSLADVASTPARLTGTAVPDALVRRVINANFRLGDLASARRVVSLVINPLLVPSMRQEALSALIDWDQPSPRDRVTGFWNPVRARHPDELDQLKSLFVEQIAVLLGQADNELQTGAMNLVAHYQLPMDDSLFASWVSDPARSVAAQSSALRLLATRKSPLALAAIELTLGGDRPTLRADARDMYAMLKPAESISLLELTLDSESASTIEKQRALKTLASLKLEPADRLLGTWTSRLDDDQVADSLQLDVLEAAVSRDLPELKQSADRFRARLALGDLMTQNRISINGGDAERGRQVFVSHRNGQCLRCHKVGATIAGGNAGPDLNQVATRHNRASLLQSLIEPNAKIAKGFESTTLVTNDGRILGGIIRSEDTNEIVLEMPDGHQVSIKVADVDERSSPKSAMPEMNRVLSPRELRDVVEFLSQLK
jgi:quinoprotein glucose dehydrogenase